MSERKHQALFDAAKSELADLLEKEDEVSTAVFHGMVARGSAFGEDDYDVTFDELAEVVRDRRAAKGLSPDVDAWLVGPDVD